MVKETINFGKTKSNHRDDQRGPPRLSAIWSLSQNHGKIERSNVSHKNHWKT